MDNVKDILISDLPIKREVDIFGTKKTFYFKELPAIVVRKYALAEESGDPDRVYNEMLNVICESLCDERGNKVLDLEQAKLLKAKALKPMFIAALTISSYVTTPEGEPVKKSELKKTQKSGSGTPYV